MKRPIGQKTGQHAVVIGASIAGLCAARVLLNHFDRVTVIDRDHLPDEAEFRKGTPQSRHLHVLLGRGQQLLEGWFPGLGDELAQAGGPLVEWGHDTRTLAKNGRWLLRYHSGFKRVSVSRVLLESRVRRRLLADSRVTFLAQHTVVALLYDPDGERVQGVRVEGVGIASDVETLTADFVVDASGRGSRTPEFLRALGFDTPQETVVNAFLGYATRWYRRPADFAGDWQWLTIQSRPPHFTRGGAIFTVEDHQWVVTLAGASKDYPPTDEDGFIAFARSLLSPDIYEAIKDAEPLSPIYGYQRTHNQWRHYDRLARWPRRFAVTGDAVCAFNPIYGQGMSAAALEAAELDRVLASTPLDRAGRQFQKRLPRVIKPVWLLATGEDFRYPATEGETPGAVTRFAHRYIDVLFDLMADHQHIAQSFLYVMELFKPPATLFRPAIALAVLRHALASRSHGLNTPAAVGEGASAR